MSIPEHDDDVIDDGEAMRAMAAEYEREFAERALAAPPHLKALMLLTLLRAQREEQECRQGQLVDPLGDRRITQVRYSRAGRTIRAAVATLAVPPCFEGQYTVYRPTPLALEQQLGSCLSVRLEFKVDPDGQPSAMVLTPHSDDTQFKKRANKGIVYFTFATSAIGGLCNPGRLRAQPITEIITETSVIIPIPTVFLRSRVATPLAAE